MQTTRLSRQQSVILRNKNCYLIRTGEGSSFEVSIDDKVMKNLGHYMVDVKSSSEDPTSIFDILKDN